MKSKTIVLLEGKSVTVHSCLLYIISLLIAVSLCVHKYSLKINVLSGCVKHSIHDNVITSETETKRTLYPAFVTDCTHKKRTAGAAS